MKPSSESPIAPHHIVIGGGFSGLYTAWKLAQAGERVQIYEAGLWGGMIQTRITPWGPVETAANGFLASLPLYSLSQTLGLRLIQPRKSAKARYLLGAKGFRRWPLGVSESLGLAFRFLKAKSTGALTPRPQETVLQWGERCLGKVAAERLVRPGVQGIYACSAEELSAELVLGRFFGKDKSRKVPSPMRGLVSFEKGMGNLPQGLSLELMKHPQVRMINKRVSPEEVKNWSEADEVRAIWLALDAPNAAKAVSLTEPGLARLLTQVQGIPVVSVTGFFESKAEQDLQGFGFLNHPEMGTDVLGVLFNSSIFQGRGPHRSETWILKGQGQNQLVTQKDNSVQDFVNQQRQKLFPNAGAPLHFEIKRWAWGLPHYSVELSQIQGEFQKNWDKIRLVGNYVKGIGLTQIADHIDERLKR